jgi:hypothetical protein
MCASCYIYTDTCDSGAQGGDDAKGHAPAARAARRAGSGERLSAPAAARARIQSGGGGGGGVLAAARESLFSLQRAWLS